MVTILSTAGNTTGTDKARLLYLDVGVYADGTYFASTITPVATFQLVQTRQFFCISSSAIISSVSVSVSLTYSV